ncbi:hypothetical protein SAMN04515656_11218 [Eubacterium aggregans]|uniref:Sigma-70, region 4 n=1 Tax=Eubacterium aggregans TaxID=81409 RepID=A0A1H4BNV1_9FIRM|nr:hypothetical protein [Eubacterium aggregans]SEA49813.1 hypothetical protein SAMN04515656_11218 [Eubacterium aggregans]
MTRSEYKKRVAWLIGYRVIEWEMADLEKDREKWAFREQRYKDQKRLEAQEKIRHVTEKIEHKVKASANKYIAIMDSIETLEDPMEQLVIKQKFINGKSLEEIAAETNYSYTQTHRYYERGIRNIEIKR